MEENKCCHKHHHEGCCHKEHHHDHPEHKLKEDFMECAHILRHRKEKRHGQKRVLRILEENGPMSQRDLAEHFDIRPASLSELLIKLEDQDYIKREKADEDKRLFMVSLTGKQMECHKHEANHKCLFDVLSEEEKEQLSSILAKLKEAWSDGEEVPMRPRRRCHHHE